VPALAPGTYTIKVELQGFTSKTRSGVVLALGQAVTVDFSLEIGAASEQLTVTADAPLLQVGRTELSSVVNQQFIDNLPINGRDFISFSVITPGVAPDRTPQQGASSTSGLSFTGQRARSNNIMVDGLDNNDPVVGAVRATFSQEAIREFQVLADSYSAEFGKASGGVVNIVTKSGTNRVRGNAFFYLRDKSLNAKNYFDKYDIFGNPVNLEKAPYNQKQWERRSAGRCRKTGRSTSLPSSATTSPTAGWSRLTPRRHRC
jgi:outer membrane receptor protein involved in Fe transport